MKEKKNNKNKYNNNLTQGQLNFLLNYLTQNKKLSTIDTFQQGDINDIIVRNNTTMFNLMDILKENNKKQTEAINALKIDVDKKFKETNDKIEGYRKEVIPLISFKKFVVYLFYGIIGFSTFCGAILGIIAFFKYILNI